MQLRRQRELARRVPPLSAAAAASPAFVDTPQLVVFTREAGDCTLCAVALGAAAMLDTLLNVSVAHCRPEDANATAATRQIATHRIRPARGPRPWPGPVSSDREHS